MEVKFCTHCGEELRETASFCTRCGIRVSSPANIPTEPANIPEPVPYIPEPEPILPEPEPVLPEPEPYAPPVAVQNPPVYTDPAPVEKPAPRVRRGFFRTILAILLSIVIFFLSFSTVLLFGLQNLAEEDNMHALLTDIVTGLDTVPAVLFDSSADNSDTLVDLVVEIANEEGLDVRNRDIEKFLKDSDLVDSVSDILHTYLEDIRNNTRKAALDTEDIEDLLDDNEKLIEDALGIEMTKSIIADTAMIVEESGALKYTDARLLKHDAPAVYYGIQGILSIWLICILGGLLLLFTILLATTNRWSLSGTFRDLGITLLVVGLLTAVPSAAAPMLSGELSAYLPVGDLLNVAVSHIARSFILSALCAFGTGILLIIIGAVAKAVSVRRR